MGLDMSSSVGNVQSTHPPVLFPSDQPISSYRGLSYVGSRMPGANSLKMLLPQGEAVKSSIFLRKRISIPQKDGKSFPPKQDCSVQEENTFRMSQQPAISFAERVFKQLEGSLSGETRIIRQCEENINKMIEENPSEFVKSLTSFLLSEGVPEHIRQTAGIVLRREIKKHWSNEQEEALDDDEEIDEDIQEEGSSEKEGKMIYDEKTKLMVRSNILKGLVQNSSSKIVTATASIVAEISTYDFPEKWPTLISDLINMIKTAPSLTHKNVYSAIKCLALVSETFSTKEISSVLQNLVPFLLGMIQKLANDHFTNPQAQDAPQKCKIIARAIQVVKECFSSIGSLFRELDNAGKNKIKSIFSAAVQFFMFLYLKLITLTKSQKSIFQAFENMAILELVKSFSSFVEFFGIWMKTYMPAMLNVVVQFLREFHVPYYTVVCDPNFSSFSEEDCFDDDGNSFSLKTVIMQTFEFLCTTVQQTRFHDMFVSGLEKVDLNDLANSNYFKQTQKKESDPTEWVIETISYWLIAYAQLSTNDIEEWNDEPNTFFSKEDVDMQFFTVRNSTIYLLLDINETLGLKALPKILSAISKRMAECANLQSQKSPKSILQAFSLREAILLVFGHLAELLNHKNAEKMFSVADLLKNILSNELSSLLSNQNQQIAVPSWLQGRAIWVSSKFVDFLVAEAEKLLSFQEQPNAVDHPNGKLMFSFLDVIISLILGKKTADKNNDQCLKLFATSTFAQIILKLKEKEKNNSKFKQYLTTKTPFFTKDVLNGVMQTFTIMLHTNITSEETVQVPLEALTDLISFEPSLAHLPNSINYGALMQGLQTYANDPFHSEDFIELFKMLLKDPISNPQVVQVLIPQISKFFQSKSISQQFDLFKTLFELVSVIIKQTSIFLAKDKNLANQSMVFLLRHIFIPLYNLMMDNDDDIVLQIGCECLRGFLYFADPQIFSQQNPQAYGFPNSPLSYVIKVLEKFLTNLPSNVKENSLASLPGVVFGLSKNYLQILGVPAMQEIWKATLQLLDMTEHIPLATSIIILFVQLLHLNYQPVMQFLCTTDITIAILEKAAGSKTVSYKTGTKKGCEILFQKWCDAQPTYYGAYSFKVTVLGMLKLINSVETLNNVPITTENIVIQQQQTQAKYATRSKSSKKKLAVPASIMYFLLLLESLFRLEEDKKNKVSTAVGKTPKDWAKFLMAPETKGSPNPKSLNENDDNDEEDEDYSPSKNGNKNDIDDEDDEQDEYYEDEGLDDEYGTGLRRDDLDPQNEDEDETEDFFAKFNPCYEIKDVEPILLEGLNEICMKYPQLVQASQQFMTEDHKKALTLLSGLKK